MLLRENIVDKYKKYNLQHENKHSKLWTGGGLIIHQLTLNIYSKLNKQTNFELMSKMHLCMDIYFFALSNNLLSLHVILLHYLQVDFDG